MSKANSRHRTEGAMSVYFKKRVSDPPVNVSFSRLTPVFHVYPGAEEQQEMPREGEE